MEILWNSYGTSLVHHWYITPTPPEPHACSKELAASAGRLRRLMVGLSASPNLSFKPVTIPARNTNHRSATAQNCIAGVTLSPIHILALKGVNDCSKRCG